MTLSDAHGNPISEDEPSPWWPCPRCGEVFWRPYEMVWQRRGVDPDDADQRNKPSGVSTINQCVQCGKYVDLARYYRWEGWGEPDGLHCCPDCGCFTRDHLDGCTRCACARSNWEPGEVL